MSVSEQQELNKILSATRFKMRVDRPPKPTRGRFPYMEDEDEPAIGAKTQWTSPDNIRFFPASKTFPQLEPGVYEIKTSSNGLYVEKIPLKTEGLIEFPETNSEKVVAEIQNFWGKEEVFKSQGLAYKRGIILWGPPGCHAAGTKVVLSDGTIKEVERVVLGDKLIGPDGLPRVVLDLCRGKDDMYRIHPVKGDSFVVNGHHILHLSRSGERDAGWLPSEINISVNEFLKLSIPSQARWKLRHSDGVEFYRSDFETYVDPYFLGLWLGDGTEIRPEITTADPEIEEYVYYIAEKYGLGVTEQRKTDSICKSLSITGGMGNRDNQLLNDLRNLGVIGNKHIPDNYLLGSRKTRLSLLSGLIDTDGGHTIAKWRVSSKWQKKGWKGYFEIIQKREILARQIVFLARSLGLAATIKAKTVNDTVYWRISIFGDIANIPTKLPRKQSLVGNPNKNPLVTGIDKVESLGTGDYYGFTLSGDHLYMTDDFVIHHNSGKSCTIQLVIADVTQNRGGVVFKLNIEPSLFLEGIRIFREVQPTTPIVILMEDIDALIQTYDESEVLNILDGVDRVEKVVFVATTNYPEELGERIMNRPSRFDKRFKMPHPRSKSRRIYFEHLMARGTVKELIDIDKWVKDTDGMSIAHLKELFIAVCILGEAYEETIATLRAMSEEHPSSKEEQDVIGFIAEKDERKGG